MRTFRPTRPSAALILSMIALIVALGGTSYAAFTLPKNSVATKHLRNGAVTAPKLKNGSVTTAKLKNGSVTLAKLHLAGLIVPSAVHATSAGTATSAVKADHATEATHATTADSASAVAYAHVLANGSLDTARSKNVAIASNPSTGVYCLKISVSVVNASATVDFGGSGKFGIASAILAGQDPAKLITSMCPAGSNALVGTADATTGTIDNRAFWATFN